MAMLLGLWAVSRHHVTFYFIHGFQVPKSTRVYLKMSSSDTLSCFLMTVRNVHCYPGVPALTKDTFQSNKVGEISVGQLVPLLLPPPLPHPLPALLPPSLPSLLSHYHIHMHTCRISTVGVQLGSS